MARNYLPWILGATGIGVLLYAARRASAAASPVAEPTLTSESTPTSGSRPATSSISSPRIILDYGPSGSLTGSSFARQLAGKDDATREAMALKALAEGQHPGFLRQLVAVPISGGGHTGTIYVTPDFIGVGTQEDWFRMPLRPGTAQRVADAWGMLLPTSKIADAVHDAARIRIRMPYFASNKAATATYIAADDRIDGRLPPGSDGSLADGHKKYVLAADGAHPGRVIIYGADNPDTGAWPLQPYSWVHSSGYVDYSHGVRLVASEMDVSGRGRMRVLDVMRDPSLASLVSSRVSDRGARYA